MSPASGRELAEKLDEAGARVLRVIAGTMGAGIALLAMVVLYIHFVPARGRVPTVENLRFINTMTMISAGTAVLAIAVSELMWKLNLKCLDPENVNAKVQSAFILRCAQREGPALLGCVTTLLAAQNGVLNAYPAYWANLAPALLLGSYLYMHWPSLENLKAELADALPTA